MTRLSKEKEFHDVFKHKETTFFNYFKTSNIDGAEGLLNKISLYMTLKDSSITLYIKS